MSGALRKLHYLVASRMAARFITFVMNVLVARLVGVRDYGIAHVHVHVLDVIVLMPREAIRRTAMRFASSITEKSKTGLQVSPSPRRVFLSLAWLLVPLSALLSVAFVYTMPFFYRRQLDSTDTDATEKAVMLYQRVLVFTAVGSMLRQLGEPLYCVAQCFLLFKLRGAIEVSAVLVKCTVTFVCAAFFDCGLMAFAYGQVAYGAVTSALYFAYFRRNSRSSHPIFTSMRHIGPTLAGLWEGVVGQPGRLALCFLWETFWRLLLGEGEKLVLVAFAASDAAQGVYSLVHNLGSIVVRLVFAPLEDAAFSEFSLLLQPPVQSRKQALRVFAILLKFMGVVGLLFIAFGPSFAFVLVHTVFGAKWSATQAPVVLQWYCAFVALLALNGVTEAFVKASFSTQQLLNYSWWLLVCSVAYVGTSALLLPFGALGIVAANACNMLTRIGYAFVSFWRADAVEAEVLVRRSLPGLGLTLAFAGACALTRASALLLQVQSLTAPWQTFALHVSVGLCALLGVLGVLWRLERGFLGQLHGLLAHRHDPKLH